MKKMDTLYVPKILAVDDDLKNLKILGAQLDEAAYRYQLVDDPLRVVETIRGMRPDVVLLDRMMPRKGLETVGRKDEEVGDTLCRMIRADPMLCFSRIIMVTAKARELDELEGLQIGADDYISKPYSEEILLERLRKQLESRRREEFEDFTRRVLTFFGNHLLNGIDIVRAPADLMAEIFNALVPGLQEMKRLVAEAEDSGQPIEAATLRTLLERSVIDPDGMLGQTSLGLLTEGVAAQRELAGQGLLYVTLLTATHPAVTHVNLRRLVDRTVQQWEDSLRTSSEATQPSIDGSPNAAFRQIHYQLDGGGKAPFLIRGVEEWLERAFLNLLDNAFRFTRDGDAITVTLRQRGDEFHIAVADTGYGMEPDQLSAIFEPFATGAGAGRFGQPRLNLPISRKVAELHNGDLRVESVPGQGSTFTLILPVV